MNSETVIRSELEPDETLLWHGQPRQGLLWRGSDWYFVPFGLFWLGFVVFWCYAVLTGGEGPWLVGAGRCAGVAEPGSG